MKKHILKLFLLLLIISCSSSEDLDNSPATQTNETNHDSDNPPETQTNETPTTQTNETNDETNTNRWLVPINEIKDGGPGKDGIPSINSPKFTTSNNATFLEDEDLIIGFILDGEPRAYPHFILNWHEIINDKSDNGGMTISYCPLTGTAFGWQSITNGEATTFGVSGLLYNANLILYDRNTDSNWSQLRLECINGPLIEDKPTLAKVVETNWKTWKTLYPNTKVLTTNTGYNRDYNRYPYGDYKTNHDRFIFSVSPLNSALPNKERVHAVIDDNKSKVYQFSKFNNGKAIKNSFNGKDYLVVGNENLICSFELDDSYSNLDFEYDFNSSENILFKDNEGNKWSVFGEVVSGPRLNQKLSPTKSVISFWFAIAAFYPKPQIY